MALSLFGERSVAAATPRNPLALLGRWIAAVRTSRARRRALTSLLELDEARLRDLGISRSDIIEALQQPRGSGLVLSSARARNSRL
ncbi:DUF1127 domain-containing protein [Devosia albogilva]|uniref:DUF1127 domain-containing protein n=1 Tax=Devosia albogilva TaxID=429726 RepID=A0ABW5QM59_9HYPH